MATLTPEQQAVVNEYLQGTGDVTVNVASK